jgi:cell division protein FtsB
MKYVILQLKGFHQMHCHLGLFHPSFYKRLDAEILLLQLVFTHFLELDELYETKRRMVQDYKTSEKEYQEVKQEEIKVKRQESFVKKQERRNTMESFQQDL